MGISEAKEELITEFSDLLMQSYYSKPYDTPLELMFDILNNSPHSAELNGTDRIGSKKQRRFVDITLSEWIGILKYYQKTRTKNSSEDLAELKSSVDIFLEADDWNALIDALEKPAKANPKLKKLLKKAEIWDRSK